MSHHIPEARELRQLRSTLTSLQKHGRRVSTNWIVITGAPGAGKSSVVDQLRLHGFRVVRDPARDILEERVLAGIAKHEARADYDALQATILQKMLQDAQAIPPQESVFFDYGLPDNLAFLSEGGLRWTPRYVEAACLYKYRCAFLLDLVVAREDLNSDSVRMETPIQRSRIKRNLRTIYRELGMPMIRVPVASVVERVNYVLQQEARLGLQSRSN